MRGATGSLFGLLAAAVLAAAPPAFGQAGKPEGLYYKSWAVVIGIDDYLVAPKLTWAVSDAKAVAQALRDLHFEEIIEVYNRDASYRRLHFILTDVLPRKVGRQDRVLIFFAGHTGATLDMNSKDLGYLVPWDAQPNAASKAVTMDHLKEFSRRVMSKHVLFLIDGGLAGWDVTPPQPLSLEGRLSPEDDTEKRAVQVLTAANKGESLVRLDGQGAFVQALVTGMKGAADADKNGWVLASELGEYVKGQVERASQGAQHPQFARLDGDGDTIILEGKKAAFRIGPEPKTDAERMAAAKEQYEIAFSLLKERRSVEEALERLDRATGYNPAYADAYVLKSYIRLEMLPNLDEALAAAKLAVQYGADNADSHYTLGLVLQRRGEFTEAEQAFRKALAVSPDYSEVYFSLGELYAEGLNDKAKAVEAYRRYLETGGTDSRAKAYVDRAGETAPKP
jgi:hypothetical protein